MNLEPQHWWVIIGIALIILEIFSPSFFAASLAVGAFASAISALYGASLEWQLGWFAIISTLSVFFVRPLAKKYLYVSGSAKTNADALIGRECLVVKGLENETTYGKVAIDGDEWQCRTNKTNLPIEKGTQVRVIERDSIILTVEPIKS